MKVVKEVKTVKEVKIVKKMKIEKEVKIVKIVLKAIAHGVSPVAMFQKLIMNEHLPKEISLEYSVFDSGRLEKTNSITGRMFVK